LDYAAETFIRSGFAQPVATDEAMRILEDCKEAGLAQTADNVQRKVSYLCNCCGCCCGMIQAIKSFNLRGAIVTSNWIMEVDVSKCKGCGQCAEICPVGAIEIREEKEGEKARKWAVREESLCLGCGVCYSVCKTGGITMKPRAQRVFTPETAFDRTVSMAIERGKLADLLGENPEELNPHATGRIIASLNRSPNAEAAMAIEPLRSAFLERRFKKGKE
jgi:ferredoxin